MRLRACLLGLLLGSTVVLPAQQASPDVSQGAAPVFRSSADLVTIDAVVTDSAGRHVTDLSAADFEVTVSGKPQDLQQAVYIKTADQPRVLAAARQAAFSETAADASPDTSRSEASRVLRKTGLQPDRIARTIALVIDDLGLSFESVYHVRRALHQYIDTQLEPGDLVAIVRTAGGVGALQQFTTDKRLLHLAADRVQWDFRSRQTVSAFTAYEPENPLRFDDVNGLRNDVTSVGSLGALEYIARGVSLLPGRKCLVFFSEGFPSMFGDRMDSGRIWEAMTRMLDRANRAGVVVYTIDARGLLSGGLTAEDNPQTRNWGPGGTLGAGGVGTVPGSGGGDAGSGNGGGSSTGGSGTAAQPGAGGSGTTAQPGARASGAGFLDGGSPRVASAGRDRLAQLLDSQESLQFIANQTGGLAVANTNDLNLGISRVLADQQGYYLLGYVAPQGAARSGWDQNRVKVRVKRPGLQVRARQGFFGPTDAAGASTTGFGPDALTAAALSPFGSGEITARLTALFGHDPKTGDYIRALLFIDSGDLQFREIAGEHACTFRVLLLAVGDNGEVTEHWGRLVNVSLKPEEFRRIRERGILVTLRIPIRQPGAYQVRASVLDVPTHAIGSASQFLEVPAVGGGRLALSGVLMKGIAESVPVDEDASAGESSSAAFAEDAPVGQPSSAGLVDEVLLQPEIRVLEAGNEAVYAYEIYDGLKPADAGELQMGTALIRDGKVVYQSPFAPVTAAPREGRKVRTITIAGKLALGKDMPAGPYTLEVIVRGGRAKKLERRQWLDFEVRR